MSTFKERLLMDKAMKGVFSEFFTEFLEDKAYIRYVGQETVWSEGDHAHVRYRYDSTTEFLRYLPDGFVFWHTDYPDKKNFFVDFKVADTGIQSDKSELFMAMRTEVDDLETYEVLGIEGKSLEHLCSLAKCDINTIIWAYSSFRPKSKWLAIRPEQAAVLGMHERGTMKNTTGAGTTIANILARVDSKRVYDLGDWLSMTFGLDKDEISAWLGSRSPIAGDEN